MKGFCENHKNTELYFSKKFPRGSFEDSLHWKDNKIAEACKLMLKEEAEVAVEAGHVLQLHFTSDIGGGIS